MHWLHSISKQLCDQNSPNRLITICAGALLAAKAGLLANCSVTSHHTELENLKGIEPLCNVVSNRVFVVDAKRNIYSSAGITTGIDLAVHLIDDVCGPVIAARVAQTMVMPLRRGLNDPALSPFLQGRAHMHAGIHRLQDAITSDLSANWTLPKMASLANTSTRNLARLFDSYVGSTPLSYLRRIRLANAQLALQAGHSVTKAAALSGFNSDTQLRRAWHDFGLSGVPSGTDL